MRGLETKILKKMSEIRQSYLREEIDSVQISEKMRSLGDLKRKNNKHNHFKTERKNMIYKQYELAQIARKNLHLPNIAAFDGSWTPDDNIPMAFSFTDMKLNTETWSVVNQPYNYNRVDTVEELIQIANEKYFEKDMVFFYNFKQDIEVFQIDIFSKKKPFFLDISWQACRWVKNDTPSLYQAASRYFHPNYKKTVANDSLITMKLALNIINDDDIGYGAKF